jgi:hypothetical protein
MNADPRDLPETSKEADLSTHIEESGAMHIGEKIGSAGGGEGGIRVGHIEEMIDGTGASESSEKSCGP